MKCPRGHKVYRSWKHANSDMQKMIDRAKRTGEGGNSWKRLNIFHCLDHWHIGRNKRQIGAPTFAFLRQRLAHLEKEWDKMNRQRAALLGQLIAIDQTFSGQQSR